MDNETRKGLSEFARKAMQRLEDKKIPKYCILYVPSLDQEIKIRSLTTTEVIECNALDNTDDPNRVDRYSIYLSAVEPNFKEVASELKSQGTITTPLEVVEMFELSEINEIATEIMRLSGIYGTPKVRVVEELKNSLATIPNRGSCTTTSSEDLNPNTF